VESFNEFSRGELFDGSKMCITVRSVLVASPELESGGSLCSPTASHPHERLKFEELGIVVRRVRCPLWIERQL